MARTAACWLRSVAALACAFAASAAGAHDSWLFRPDAPPPKGAAQFVFGTGTQYPIADSFSPPSSVSASGCVDAAGRMLPLRPFAQAGKLLLQTTRVDPNALGCWAELGEQAITLKPELVNVYLREIRPSAPLLARWAALREQGLPWQERYRKFARIETSGRDTPAAALRAIRQPVNQPLEIVVSGEEPLLAGRAAAFQVLANGAPVPLLAVELRSERSPIGIWSQSDAEGRLRFTLPFSGAWLLRATLLEADGASGWQSRFVTLAFDAH
ncbi:MAG: DUF4198 domain-containing protein [Pseudomonadota bacterium]